MGGHPDESNCALQNCQHFAPCGSRGEHICRREILAGSRGNERSAPPRRSPSLLRLSGSRTRGVLFVVCSIRCISCLASGWAGQDNSSGHWCPGMGALRVSTPWGLRELQGAFWSCTDSCGCTCNLHWLGSLAVKRCPLNVASGQVNEWWANQKKPGLGRG